MRKSSAGIVLFFIVFTVTGQYPKQIELFEVVKMYAPDSVKGDSYPGAFDWNIGSDKGSPFKWKTETPEFTSDKTIKKAQAIMSIKDSTLKCNDGKDLCPWALILDGARMGYTKFNIVSPTHPAIRVKPKIDALFPGQKYSATLIKTCESSSTAGFYFYELIISGKKKMLMKISWASVTSGSAFALAFYTDFKDVDLNCIVQ